MASDEAARLSRDHHEYMLATHDLDEQGVEFDCMPDDNSQYSFGQARHDDLALGWSSQTRNPTHGRGGSAYRPKNELR